MDFRVRGRVSGEFGGGAPRHRLDVRRGHLVDLGEDDLVGDAARVEQIKERPVGLFDAVAGVDQQTGAAQCGARLQIETQEPVPARNLAFRRLGVAVARQIDQHEPVRNLKEIELARAPRCARGARQHAPAAQRIEKARLADIRAPGKGNLGQTVGGKRGGFAGGRDKAGLAREQAPARFACRGSEVARRKQPRRPHAQALLR